MIKKCIIACALAISLLATLTSCSLILTYSKNDDNIITLPDLPVEVKEYDMFSGSLESSIKITNIEYDVKGDDLYLYFTGEKTYEKSGEFTSISSIDWKLYDSEGYVVASGRCFILDIDEGDKFKDKQDMAFGVIEKDESYTLALENSK